MENTTFLFVTKEKIEIAMPRKKKVRIVLLLLSIRVKVSCYKLHKQMYLTFKLKVLLKFEFCLTQECFVNEKVCKHLILKTIRTEKH